MNKPLTLLALTAALGLTSAAAHRDETVSITVGNAEGFWVATAPSGVNVKWGILENGDTWGFYDLEGTILGAFHGNTRSSQGVLHGSGQTFDIPSRTFGSANFTGTYVPLQAISITTSHGIGFSGRYVTGYDQPASLNELAGQYSGEGLSSLSPVTSMGMSVAASGAVVLSSNGGCTANGTATPRPGNKNVFNMLLQFVGRDCALGHGSSVSGVAYFNTMSGELFVLAMNKASTDGWLYLGARVGE